MLAGPGTARNWGPRCRLAGTSVVFATAGYSPNLRCRRRPSTLSPIRHPHQRAVENHSTNSSLPFIFETNPTSTSTVVITTLSSLRSAQARRVHSTIQAFTEYNTEFLISLNP